ncbi:MAG TPA: S9 family peptidase [Candidatus Dormibacteraeota bacterium]|jgi:dipeptidyl aminopeptidase/acylaminoacyl peptidase|nr:S9 family peptidase [Candidatus Dormibacteraeota bacterium]
MGSQPLTPEDLHRYRWVEHPRLSADGRWVAWQERWADPEARENRAAVWVAKRDGREPRRLTDPEQTSRAPEWSPDGSLIACLGRRGGSDQLLVVPAAGGEERRLTDLPDGVRGFEWAPDGRSLALLGAHLAVPDDVVEDPREAEGEGQRRRPPVARVTRGLDSRHDGSGYRDGRRTHAFFVSIDGGEPRQLTRGDWDVTGLAWSPDGATLALTGDPEPGADLRRTWNLYLTDARGGELRPLLTGGQPAGLAWSPDGALLAYAAPNQPASGFSERVWVISPEGGRARCLTPALDRSVGGAPVSDMRVNPGPRLVWSEDSHRIHFSAGEQGTSDVCSVDLEGRIEMLTVHPRGAVVGFDVRADAVATCVTDAASPGEIWVAAEGRDSRITDANPWLTERWLAEPEAHWFTGDEGWAVQGWLLRPPGFDPERRHPLVLEIHGGPHGHYGWAHFHELQVLAGMGHLVLYCNPRGSSGYGEAFCRAVVRDWGAGDYRDLMLALDQTIERLGCVDTTRLGIAGGSYGGYMTNWAIGQTDRFAAAVAMRSICNLVTQYTEDDIPTWNQEEMGRLNWPDPDELWRRSPLRYVEAIRTPLLLLHNEMDLRCPISQADQLFGALHMLGREVQMVRFPGESHDLSRSGRPDRRVERLRRIAGWFERHLGRG